jgi:ubiquinone/menaquinone biosynthesis C-methylase UbiE
MSFIHDTRRIYQRIAPFYDFLELPFEYGLYRFVRPLLFHEMSGRILDAGVGTGRNMSFYPAGSEVVGIDLSTAMLGRARRRCAHSPAPVQLMAMDLAQLAFRASSFDAAVATFVFCVLPEALQIPALHELQRVVKPGGIIRFLNYARPRRAIARFMAAMSESWVDWAFAASLDRETERHIAEIGLTITDARFVAGDFIRLIEAENRSPAPPAGHRGRLSASTERKLTSSISF